MERQTKMFNEIFETAAAPQYQLKQLTLADMEEVHQLMMDTRESLPENQKHFLKPQDLPMLKQHIAKDFPVLGVIDTHTNRLAAAMMITPTNQPELCNNVDGYPKQLLASDAAIVQCVAVHPDFRKQGLMPLLLSGAEEIAAASHIVELVAKIADENTKSRNGFINAGYAAVAAGLDPKLGYAVTYWQKELQQLPQGLDIKPGTGPNMAHDAAKYPAFANI